MGNGLNMVSQLGGFSKAYLVQGNLTQERKAGEKGGKGENLRMTHYSSHYSSIVTTFMGDYLCHQLF